MELWIPADMVEGPYFADSGLLKRALRNLIGNSVRHNPRVPGYGKAVRKK